MLLPTHLAVDALVMLGFQGSGALQITSLDWILIFAANLIDLDHFWSQPIYQAGRNSFKTHFIHKNWLVISIAAISTLFWRPLMFLGIGLLVHFVLDFVDVGIRRLNFLKHKTDK